jgi:enterochelin esterase-like enzyme
MERSYRLSFGEFQRGVTFIDTGNIADEKTFIFMTDGQMSGHLTEALSQAAASMRKRFILVGLDSDQQIRSQEYLSNHEDPRYRIHEKVFRQVLPTLTSELYAAAITRQNTILLGFSNGASYVLSLGLRHPTEFNQLVLFSPARDSNHLDLIKAAQDRLLVFIAVGDQPSNRIFEKYSKSIAKSLKVRGNQVSLESQPFGHSVEHVIDVLPHALLRINEMSNREAS